jgi:hypothetical protein
MSKPLKRPGLDKISTGLIQDSIQDSTNEIEFAYSP